MGDGLAKIRLANPLPIAPILERFDMDNNFENVFLWWVQITDEGQARQPQDRLSQINAPSFFQQQQI